MKTLIMFLLLSGAVAADGVPAITYAKGGPTLGWCDSADCRQPVKVESVKYGLALTNLLIISGLLCLMGFISYRVITWSGLRSRRRFIFS